MASSTTFSSENGFLASLDQLDVRYFWSFPTPHPHPDDELSNRWPLNPLVATVGSPVGYASRLTLPQHKDHTGTADKERRCRWVSIANIVPFTRGGRENRAKRSIPWPTHTIIVMSSARVVDAAQILVTHCPRH